MFNRELVVIDPVSSVPRVPPSSRDDSPGEDGWKAALSWEGSFPSLPLLSKHSPWGGWTPRKTTGKRCELAVGGGKRHKGRGGWVVKKGPECLAANPKQGEGDYAMGVGPCQSQ